MNITTNFSFRGARKYLHSTVLFDYLIKLDYQPKQIDYIFHKETDSQCRVVAEREEGNDVALVATYKSQGMEVYVYETSEKIISRVACNESEILSATSIFGTRASFDLPISGATFIEIIVAAYKALINSLPLYNGQRLIFARLTIDYLPKEKEFSFIVEHKRSLGKNFFEANLILEEKIIGKLIFGSK